MGKLSIHCHGCGSDWVVYHRDDWKSWKSRTCPVCGEAVDPGTWKQSVLRAFGEMEDAQIELVKDHTQSHGTLFTVSYIPEVHTEERNRLRDEIKDLRDEIGVLTEVVTDLIERG